MTQSGRVGVARQLTTLEAGRQYRMRCPFCGSGKVAATPPPRHPSGGDGGYGMLIFFVGLLLLQAFLPEDWRKPFWHLGPEAQGLATLLTYFACFCAGATINQHLYRRKLARYVERWNCAECGLNGAPGHFHEDVTPVVRDPAIPQS